jgi:mannonate dehydratase
MATSTPLRVLRILKDNNFQGVIIPTTPPKFLRRPWHAGMAFALGYLRAGIQSLT